MQIGVDAKVVLDRQQGLDCSLLQNHGDVTPHVQGLTHHVKTADLSASRGRSREGRENLYQRAFPCAVGAKQSVNFTRRHLERNPVEGSQLLGATLMVDFSYAFDCNAV